MIFAVLSHYALPNCVRDEKCEECIMGLKSNSYKALVATIGDLVEDDHIFFFCYKENTKVAPNIAEVHVILSHLNRLF